MKKLIAVVVFIVLGYIVGAQYLPPAVAAMQLTNIADGTSTAWLSSNQPTVVVVYSPECPMCQSYTLTLKQLKEKYGTAFRWVALFPGKAYSAADILNFSNKYQFHMQLLADTGFAVTKALKASVTPEAFLIDPKGKILYQGAVDNWLTELGKKRNAATRHYLADALAANVEGKRIAVTKTIAKGCLINDY